MNKIAICSLKDRNSIQHLRVGDSAEAMVVPLRGEGVSVTVLEPFRKGVLSPQRCSQVKLLNQKNNLSLSPGTAEGE